MLSASKISSAARSSIISFVILMLLASIFITYPPNSFAEMGMQELPTTTETITPPLLYNETWKISNADGVADWSPTEDILVVSTWAGFEPRVMLYGTNGTKLMTIAEFRQDEFISSARFSPNGSRIAFTHTMPPDSSSQLQVFDLKTKASQNFQFQGNFTYFDWMPDGNHIIYLTPDPKTANQFPLVYQLRIYDIRTGSETVIHDSLTNVESLDLSQDGMTLLLVQNVAVQEPCQIGKFPSCAISQIVTLKLEHRQEAHDDISTDSYSEQVETNNTQIISSQVIEKVSSPYFIAFPRWVLNDSAVVYSQGHYRCGGPMLAISPDGTRNQSLFSPSSGDYVYGACYEKGGVINGDGTIIAYAKSSGIQASGIDFNPVNSGLYLTFTEICSSKPCTTPSKTIPLVKGRTEGVSQPISQYGNPSYNLFLSVGYEIINDGPKIDENTKTLSMTLQGPRVGDNIGERDVMLYLPSSLIDGDMAILINGTQIFPAEQSKNCLSIQTEEFCSRIKADIYKIDGWSIVNITDDTTDNRSVINIDIVGTTVTPEFTLGIPVLIITLFMTGAIVMQKIKAK